MEGWGRMRAQGRLFASNNGTIETLIGLEHPASFHNGMSEWKCGYATSTAWLTTVRRRRRRNGRGMLLVEIANETSALLLCGTNKQGSTSSSAEAGIFPWSWIQVTSWTTNISHALPSVQFGRVPVASILPGTNGNRQSVGHRSTSNADTSRSVFSNTTNECRSFNGRRIIARTSFWINCTPHVPISLVQCRIEVYVSYFDLCNCDFF